MSLDRTFGALADPTRRSILQLVSTAPASLGELARPFEISGDLERGVTDGGDLRPSGFTQCRLLAFSFGPCYLGETLIRVLAPLSEHLLIGTRPRKELPANILEKVHGTRVRRREKVVIAEETEIARPRGEER